VRHGGSGIPAGSELPAQPIWKCFKFSARCCLQCNLWRSSASWTITNNDVGNSSLFRGPGTHHEFSYLTTSYAEATGTGSTNAQWLWSICCQRLRSSHPTKWQYSVRTNASELSSGSSSGIPLSASAAVTDITLLESQSTHSPGPPRTSSCLELRHESLTIDGRHAWHTTGRGAVNVPANTK
jgi:hypothetical protein